MSEPIEIVINGRFLTQRVTGVQRIAEEFVTALDKLVDEKVIDGNRYRFTLVSPNRLDHELELKHIPHQKSGFFTGHVWEQIELPRFTRGKMLLSLCGPSPVLKFRQIVLLPDANVFVNPKFFTRPYGLWHRVIIPILGKMARKIITISDFSKTELVKRARIDPSKIHVVYLGREQILRIDGDHTILSKHGLDKGKYVLAVSSHNPNKNFHTLAKAISMLEEREYKYVVAGGDNPRVFGELKKCEDVTYLGYVSDAELKELYTGAACFVYPSFYEGFGLPPIEAMACGCPVIVSNSSSLPEICGQAAVYCNPHNAADIANQIRTVINDVELQNTLKQKGSELVQRYSWTSFVMQTLEIINSTQ